MSGSVRHAFHILPAGSRCGKSSWVHIDRAFGRVGLLTQHHDPIRAEPGYGNGRTRTAFTKVKIVVFAPMPSASDNTAAAVKPGLRRSSRTPWRRS